MKRSASLVVIILMLAWGGYPALANISSVFMPTAQFGRGFGLPLSITCAGYSICQYSSYNAASNYPAYGLFAGYADQGVMTWLQRYSRGRFFMDVTDGYQGTYYGIVKYTIQNSGTGYKNTDTATVTGGCTSNPVPGAITVNVSGAITSIAVGTAGSGCTARQVVSITTSTGSGFAGIGVVGGSGNFGNAGENSTQFLSRLSDVMAAKSNIIVLHEGGLNDVADGLSVATTEANLMTIYQSLLSAGKIVVDVVEGPINTALAARTANQYKQIMQINAWRKNYIRKLQAQQVGGAGRILYLDATPELTDGASALGAPLVGMFDTTNGFHPQTPAAMLMGWKLWQQLAPLVGVNAAGVWGSDVAGNQIDLYDATYNPYGFRNSNPFMTGTAGTTSTGCTGTTVTGWTTQRTTGTGASGCTVAVESSRSDLYSGARQVMTIATGSATSAEKYGFYIVPTLASLSLSVGQIVYGTCDVELSNVANMNQLQLILTFFDGSFVQMGGAIDGGNTTTFKLVNSSALGGLTSSTPLTLRTPPMAIPTGTTQFAFDLFTAFDGSGAAGSATATIKLVNCGVKLAL